jgi:hypothetical protein
LDFKDLFLAPLYMLVFYSIASKIKSNHFSNHPFEKYFNRALFLKFFGAIAAGMVYWFYYDYGDTRGFFTTARHIQNHIFSDYSLILNYTFPSDHIDQPYKVLKILRMHRAFEDTSSYFMVRVTVFLLFLTFTTYSCSALFFAFFSFLSSLYLYKVLYRKYPELHKQLAIAIFFIPSVFFWGSGLFKDSLTFSGLCLVTGGALNVLDLYKPLKSSLLIALGAFLILNIKAYILLSLAPCLGFYIFYSYNHKIKSAVIRKFSVPLFLIVGLGAGYLFLIQISSYSSEWSLDQVQGKAKDMQQWHDMVAKIYGGDGSGSNYSVGDIGDFSVGGMLSKLPIVLSITFYRPFLWEVKNPFMLLTSLEGILFMWLTYKLFRAHGIKNVFTSLPQNPIALFCFAYAIIFGFAVGYTSYNYGALARYKIPCLPFYLLFVYFSDYYLSKKKLKLSEK